MNPATYLRDTIDLIKQIETRFLELGSRLWAIKEKELWKDNYDSYSEFLDVAKVNAGHASILVSIHKTYVEQLGFPREKLAGIGYSNLYEAIPLLDSTKPEKVLEMARTLTRAEIKEEVREGQHGECDHAEKITICAKCHKRI